MAAADTPAGLDALAAAARQGPIATALAGFGAAVAGRNGHLASAGHVIRGTDAAWPVIGGDGVPVEEERITAIDDPVLPGFGLRLCRVDGAPGSRGALPALAIRIGLLNRMLDLAYDHLKPRVSFGQRTLTHQLVKAGFAEAHGAALLLLERARLREATGELDGIDADHGELARVEAQAEKLMGGHGYLAGGTHAVSYLSLLLHSLHGRAS